MWYNVKVLNQAKKYIALNLRGVINVKNTASKTFYRS